MRVCVCACVGMCVCVCLFGIYHSLVPLRSQSNNTLVLQAAFGEGC